jgi:uncharacterized protein
MNWKEESKWLIGFVALFFLLYFLPVGVPRFDNALIAALELAKWYAREHVILCLIPAFFIAGAISVFISHTSIMKYFGAKAHKGLSYGVAAISGTILAVCSCTVLPLFAGIYKRGAGLGPAIAFLYSGPAINVLAIILTARILGLELGVARAISAVVFSIVLGLIMHGIFIEEENEKYQKQMMLPEFTSERSLWKNALYFFPLCAVLVFANWSKGEETSGFFYLVYSWKWTLTSLSALMLTLVIIKWFHANVLRVVIAISATILASIFFSSMPIIPFSVGIIGLSWILCQESGELENWLYASWDFSKQIMPLLFAGVFLSGFFLGRAGHEGVIPASWVALAVGNNSFAANFFSSVAGAFMYFATLTEVPIIQGLMQSGMHKGPALALLLSGPALSLPSMLVLRSIMGLKKTVIYVSLVIVMSTITGILYGMLF